MPNLSAKQLIERFKGAERLAKDLDAALLKDIKENGPMLIWLGEGDFPRESCSFRGLSIGKGRNRLSKWLGVLDA